MILKIHHSTRYTYDHPVPYALQQVRVTPQTKNTQKVHDWKISIQGGDKMLSFHDHHENIVNLISCEENTTEVTVCCDGIVEVQDAHGISGEHAGFAPLWLYLRGNDVTKAGVRVRKVTSSLTGTIVVVLSGYMIYHRQFERPSRTSPVVLKLAGQLNNRLRRVTEYVRITRIFLLHAVVMREFQLAIYPAT